MRKYRLLNWLMILLFIGTVLTVFMLRNQAWDYANLLGNHRNSVKVAADVSFTYYFGGKLEDFKVDKLITSHALNDEFRDYITKTIEHGGAVDFMGLRVFNVDCFKFRNVKALPHKSYLSPYSETKEIPKARDKLKNIANVDYQDRNFKIQLKPLPLFIGIYFTIFLFDIIVLLILLILALKNNPKYQIYLRSIYLIYFFKIGLFIWSLFTSYFQTFCLLSQLSAVMIHIIFILTFYKVLASYHISIPRLLIAAILTNLWFDTIWIPISIYIVSFTLIIFSESGVKRKIYLQNLFFALLFICSSLMIATIISLIMDFIGIGVFGSSDNYSGYIISLNLFQATRYGLFFILNSVSIFIISILVIMSLISRILKIKLLIIEHLYFWVLKLYLVLITVSLTLGIWYIDYSSKFLRAIGIIILATLVYLFYNKYLKLFPFINPIRFNINKEMLNLLNASYEHTNHTEYTEFFFNFLKKIHPKAKISIIYETNIVGDVMPQLRYSRLIEVIELNSKNKPYLNLDIELLDDTEIGKNVEDFNNNDLPHLLYPIYNKQGELQVVIAFGKFPGIYWQKSLTEAIHKLVEVFSGFYLNFLVQEKFMQQGKAIVKEQEERLYNHKLWEVESKKNEELQAERQHIMKSMEYASLIQKSILPQSQEMLAHFPQHFVIWQQRDIVGGDLYWLHPIPDSTEVIFSVIDCTGHGVPGALMSVASNSALEQLVHENSNYNPGRLLSNLHQSVGNTLHQSEMNTQQDGMDMSIIKYNKNNKGLSFAGANHNLILIKGKTQELIRVRGDRYSIGGLKWKNEIKFNQHDLELESGDTIYLFSDGVVDQPFQHSVDKLRRLGSKAWHDFLVENNQQNMEDVKISIEKLIDEMRESSPQRDDICIVGIRV